jgi:hypothetical protein
MQTLLNSLKDGRQKPKRRQGATLTWGKYCCKSATSQVTHPVFKCHLLSDHHASAVTKKKRIYHTCWMLSVRTCKITTSKVILSGLNSSTELLMAHSVRISTINFLTVHWFVLLQSSYESHTVSLPQPLSLRHSSN